MSDHAPVVLDPARAAEAAASLRVPRRWFRRAKTFGDVAREPEKASPWAGIVVVGKGVARQGWSASAELSPPLYADLRERTEPPPSDHAPRRFRVLDERAPTPPSRCTSCSERPGRGECPVCRGRALVLAPAPDGDAQWVRCDTCIEGFVTCPVCDGTMQVHRTRLRYVTDTVLTKRALDLPGEARVAAPAFTSHDGWDRASRELACDPRSADVRSAYRGSSAAVPVSFHGFVLGSAARSSVARATEIEKALMLAEVRFFAVPFWLLRYAVGLATHHVVVRVWPDGHHHAKVVG